MKARVWELTLSLLGFLLGGLLLLGGAYPAGVFFIAIASAWLASRLRIVEPGHVAGLFAIRRGQLELAKCLVLFAIYIAIFVTFIVARDGHWQRDPKGQVATYALAGPAFFVLRELVRIGRSAERWLTGGWAEYDVGELLHTLRDDGWTVIDNLVRDDGWGNVDHVVSAPHGTFAVETKSGTLQRRHLRQAVGNAVWVKKHLGVRWVTAVVCVQDDVEPHQDGWVWVVGRRFLADWLRQPTPRPT